MSRVMYPVSFIDAPEIFDCSSTNIPGSASSPIQIVSSLVHQVFSITVQGNTANFIGLYEGAIGSETLKLILGVGQPKDHAIILAKNSRLSLRSMTISAINFGSLSITFNAIF